MSEVATNKRLCPVCGSSGRKFLPLTQVEIMDCGAEYHMKRGVWEHEGEPPCIEFHRDSLQRKLHYAETQVLFHKQGEAAKDVEIAKLERRCINLHNEAQGIFDESKAKDVEIKKLREVVEKCRDFLKLELKGGGADLFWICNTVVQAAEEARGRDGK